MGIAGPHQSVIMLTSYLNNLNYKLMQISDRRQAVTAERAYLIEQYSAKAMRTNNAVYNASAAANANALATGNQAALNNAIAVAIGAANSSSWTNDPDIQLLELQDNDFDMQQKKMETQIKAVSANLDSQQKLLDGNIKKDFGSSMSV